MRASGRTPKFNEEGRRKVAEVYFTTDKSRQEVADEFSISVSTVRKYVKEFEGEFKHD